MCALHAWLGSNGQEVELIWLTDNGLADASFLYSGVYPV